MDREGKEIGILHSMRNHVTELLEKVLPEVIDGFMQDKFSRGLDEFEIMQS